MAGGVGLALDIEHEKSLRASFARQSFMTTLGARLLVLEPGRVVIGYERRDDLLQQHGFLHAGVATSAADSACGYCALTLAPTGSDVLTIEFKANFLRPASGRVFEATGRVIKPGRTIMVCEGQVGEKDGAERLIATLSATMIVQSGGVPRSGSGSGPDSGQ